MNREKTLRELTEELVAKDVELRESEELFRNLFCLSPIPMCITDDEGTFIEVNKSFLEISGYTYDEVKGRNLIEMNFYKDMNDRIEIFKSLNSVGYIKNKIVIFNGAHGKITTLLSSKKVLCKNKWIVLTTMLLLDEIIVNLSTGEQYYKRGKNIDNRGRDNE